MKMIYDTRIGTSENGACYRVTVPRIEGDEVFCDFYERYAKSFARCGGGLSSVVVSAQGEVLGERMASVLFEITAFREGRVCAYAMRSQTWDLKKGVILSLRDLNMQDLPRDLRAWVKNEGKNGIGWHLLGGQIHMYLCNPNATDLSRLRRSQYCTVVQDHMVGFEKSRVLSEMQQHGCEESECDRIRETQENRKGR